MHERGGRLIAKPIIDMLAAVADFERTFACVTAIERLGYEYKGGKARTSGGTISSRATRRDTISVSWKDPAKCG